MITTSCAVLALAAVTTGEAEAQGRGFGGVSGGGGFRPSFGGGLSRPGFAGRGVAFRARSRAGIAGGGGGGYGRFGQSGCGGGYGSGCGGYGYGGGLGYYGGYGYGVYGFGYGGGSAYGGNARVEAPTPGYVAVPGIRESPVQPPAIYVIGDPARGSARGRGVTNALQGSNVTAGSASAGQGSGVISGRPQPKRVSVSGGR